MTRSYLRAVGHDDGKKVLKIRKIKKLAQMHSAGVALTKRKLTLKHHTPKLPITLRTVELMRSAFHRLLLARDKNGATASADSTNVWRRVRGIHIRVERTGVCSAEISERDAGTTDVDVFVAGCLSDEGIDVGHGPAIQAGR